MVRRPVHAPELVLIPLDGQPIPPFRPTPDGASLVGRSAESDLFLDVAKVSRRHARIVFGPSGWTIEDCGSRHGTFVDGARLAPNVPTAIRDRTIVAFGPSRFRASVGDDEARSLVSIKDDGGLTRGSTPSRVTDEEIGALAKRRLDALVEVSAAMQSAAVEEDVAIAALDAAVRGTGFDRATWVRPCDRTGAELAVLGATTVDGSASGGFAVSRTLLQAAKDGAIVRLEDQPILQEAVSVVASGTTSALCVPVTIGRDVDSFLYLATGRGGRQPQPDAAAFCAALARFCGLAVANLRRRKLEEQQALLHRELEQAREVQRRFTPPERGRAGPFFFAVHAQPGRFVAGDMVGMRLTEGGGGLAYVGDVTGKGMGPGLLMSLLQSFLDAVPADGSLAELVGRASAHFGRYASDDRFATLWLCRALPGSRRIEIVDAGHGLAVVMRGSVASVVPRAGGGPPLGVVPDFPYEPSSIDLAPGDRLILLTDGVTEQTDPSGEQFGVERLVAALHGSRAPEEDVARIREAVAAFAAGTAYSDDLTVASLAIEAGP
jgi:serine phosphatase RsbU (regulator of sigma subunit)